MALSILQALPICYQHQQLSCKTWDELKLRKPLTPRTALHALVILDEEPYGGKEEKEDDAEPIEAQSTWYQGVLVRIMWQGLHRFHHQKHVTVKQHFGGQTIAICDQDVINRYPPPALHMRAKKAQQYPIALLLLLCRTRHAGLATLPIEILQLILDHYSSDQLINGCYHKYMFVLEGGQAP